MSENLPSRRLSDINRYLPKINKTEFYFNFFNFYLIYNFNE